MIDHRFSSTNRSWHRYFLAVTSITINLVTVSAIFAPNAGNRSVANFEFPQQIKLKSGQIIASSQLRDITTASSSQPETIKTKQKYQYILNKSEIAIEINYLVNTRGDIESYLGKYTNIPPEIIKTKQIKQLAEIGHHALISHQGHAYLSSCISPRSLSSVTHKQFSQHRYQNDLKLPIFWEWLQGKASIRDRRCLWVHLSAPIITDAQATYEALEMTWQDLYRWWKPNFPSLSN